MDQLKHFIDTNREAFEDDRLPTGHLRRFRQKLPASRKRHAAVYYLSALAVAAGVALLFLVRYPARLPQEMGDNPDIAGESGCLLREEIDGLRLYYDMQLNDVAMQIQAIDRREAAPGTQGLSDGMRLVLADSRRFEEQILPELPCSDDALRIIDQHYKASLENLRFMLSQMEELKRSDRR